VTSSVVTEFMVTRFDWLLISSCCDVISGDKVHGYTLRLVADFLVTASHHPPTQVLLCYAAGKQHAPVQAAVYVVISRSMEGISAESMMGKHACCSSQHTSTSIIPLGWRY
jgi:hypothetical protein